MEFVISAVFSVNSEINNNKIKTFHPFLSYKKVIRRKANANSERYNIFSSATGFHIGDSICYKVTELTLFPTLWAK